MPSAAFDLEKHQQRRAAVRAAFRPMSPVSNREVFAGRLDQMNEVMDVVYQAGQHAAIYGERGVGKTSLAGVMATVLDDMCVAVKVNCSVSDTFDQLWRQVLSEITFTERRRVGFSEGNVTETHLTVEDFAGSRGSELRPDDVRRGLQLAAAYRPAVIFLDEFDRLASEETKAGIADTLKMISDQGVDATIVLVGVADDVDELIAEHRSTERALAQIHMPRMESDELDEIIERGLTQAQMTIDGKAQERIVRLSQGLPHYTHLITQDAALIALDEIRTMITQADVTDAVKRALARAHHSVKEAYRQATTSNRRDNLYQQVLLACALAETDDHGFFAAADLRAPLSKILKKPVDIPAFAQHLKAFSGGGQRQAVLQKRGTPRRWRYRFVNPLLQPFIVMKGMTEQMIDADDARTA